MATDKGNTKNEIAHWTNNEIGIAVQSWLWVSECELYSIWTKFSVFGFKSHSGQLQWWIMYVYIYIYIYIYI